MKFYLGTPAPPWTERADVPMFLSRRRISMRKRPLKPLSNWALDSGGFTELSMHGAWTISPQEYAHEVARYATWGKLDFAAIQDWMCEPKILARTGLTVRDHQERTIESYITLMGIDSSLPWMPVLQGWDIHDYHRHVEMYEQSGVSLSDKTVGLGSVCRRQASREILSIVSSLQPLRLHGFGVKQSGISLYGDLLYSCDSMAWSVNAWRSGVSNWDLAFALDWREKMLARPVQSVMMF